MMYCVYFHHSMGGEVADCSSESAVGGEGVATGRVGEEERGNEREEEMDSVLLFDEKTDSFQLYKEKVYIIKMTLSLSLLLAIIMLNG